MVKRSLRPEWPDIKDERYRSIFPILQTDYLLLFSTITDCITVEISEMMSDLPGSAVSCSRLAVIQEGGESAVWLVWG